MCWRRVRNHRASNRNWPAVVVMSLAGPRAASLNDAIDATANAGITVVVAAGECLLDPRNPQAGSQRPVQAGL